MNLNVIGIVIAASGMLALAASAQTVSIGTNPQGSLAYAAGADVLRLIDKIVDSGSPV